MRYLTIKRKDGSVNTVRYECETVNEPSLTYHEEIIKELYHKNEELIEFIRDCYYNKTFQDKCPKSLIDKNDKLYLNYKEEGER